MENQPHVRFGRSYIALAGCQEQCLKILTDLQIFFQRPLAVEVKCINVSKELKTRFIGHWAEASSSSADE